MKLKANQSTIDSGPIRRQESVDTIRYDSFVDSLVFDTVAQLVIPRLRLEFSMHLSPEIYDILNALRMLARDGLGRTEAESADEENLASFVMAAEKLHKDPSLSNRVTPDDVTTTGLRRYSATASRMFATSTYRGCAWSSAEDKDAR